MAMGVAKDCGVIYLSFTPITRTLCKSPHRKEKKARGFTPPELR